MQYYGFIYITTNTINDKKYLGMCAYHKLNHKTYLGSGKALRRAIKKYGSHSFTRTVLKECRTKEELIQSEMYYINLYNCVTDRSWYNINAGGYTTKGFSGKKHSDETKRKMSANHKRPIYETTIDKFRINGKERIKHLHECLKNQQHPCSKSIIYFGKIYNSIKECSEQHNINRLTLRKKLNDPNFKDAAYLS